jgi:hypothetical protein
MRRVERESPASQCAVFDFGTTTGMVTDGAVLTGWRNRSNDPDDLTITKVLPSPAFRWESIQPAGLAILSDYWILRTTNDVPTVPAAGVVVFTATDTESPTPSYSDRCRLNISMSTLKVTCNVSMRADRLYYRMQRGLVPYLSFPMPPPGGPPRLFTVAWRFTATDMQLTVTHGPKGAARVPLRGSNRLPVLVDTVNRTTYRIAGESIRIHLLHLCRGPVEDETVWSRTIAACDARWASV